MRSLIVMVGLLGVILVSSVPVTAQTVTIFQDEKIIDYQLPYPGILPDNPLFIIKQIRDSFQLATAGTPLEKARISLQLADKDMAAGVQLSEKGKHKLSEEQMSSGQVRLERAIAFATEDSDSDRYEEIKEFFTTLEKANRKHLETIEELMKTAPQGQVQALERLRTRNREIAGKIAAVR